MTDPTIALTLRDILELGGVTVAATGIIVGTRYAVGAVQREGLAAIAALTVSFNAQLDSMRKALEPHADVPERLAAVEANVANAARAAETAHGKAGQAISMVGVLDSRIARIEGQLDGHRSTMDSGHGDPR